MKRWPRDDGAGAGDRSIWLAVGQVTEEAIADAIEHQAVLGGKLGTNLVERGWLSEEILADFLARQYGVPCAFGEIEVDRAVADLVPRLVADKFEVVPWKLV